MSKIKKKVEVPQVAKEMSQLDKLKADYFERFPNVNEFFVTDDLQFFFKRNDAQFNAKGKNVLHVKRDN